MSTFHRYVELAVDQGRVSCPVRRSTRIENCIACLRVRAVDLDPKHPTVQCLLRPLFNAQEEFFPN